MPEFEEHHKYKLDALNINATPDQTPEQIFKALLSLSNHQQAELYRVIKQAFDKLVIPDEPVRKLNKAIKEQEDDDGPRYDDPNIYVGQSHATVIKDWNDDTKFRWRINVSSNKVYDDQMEAYEAGQDFQPVLRVKADIGIEGSGYPFFERIEEAVEEAKKKIRAKRLELVKEYDKGDMSEEEFCDKYDSMTA